MGKTILVLGAGTGGIITAKELSKKAGKDTKILIFEKEEKNVFAPSLLWLMTGKRKPEKIYRNTAGIKGEGIKLILAEIEEIDPKSISITAGGKKYRGDYMVISLGVRQVSDQIPNQSGYNFYTLNGAAGFNNALNNFKGGKIAVLVSSIPFKCPAAPYEAAMLIEDHIQKNGLKDKTQISLYSPEPGPMPVAGSQISGKVKEIIENKGISYFPGHQLVSAGEKSLTFENGHTANYDLLAFTPVHKIPEVLKNTSLIGKSGWVEVDKETMETNFPNIYAIGDVTFIPLEMGKPLPKAGIFAHAQAEVVAHNIDQKIRGRKNFKKFSGNGQCFLETGEGKAGFAGGNFYAAPLPNIKMKKPGFLWHIIKVLFEKYWFYKYF